MTQAKERVRFFEIYQPLCNLRYGIGGCPAVLGVDSEHKCFNTLATCPVPLSFDPGELVLRFAFPQQDLLQYGFHIPALVDLSLTPAELNIGAMDRSASSLGLREQGSAVIGDFDHSDLGVDPYRLERLSGAAMNDPAEAYDPATRGTFLGKWIARNPQAVNYTCAVREGLLGEPLEDMRVCYYVIDSIAGPAGGKATIKFSDLFSRIEKRKSVAPAASPGELQAGISDIANNAQLSPPGIGNLSYAASGYVQIADEVMAFTRAGDSLTFTERGALGTVASDHDEEDLVQEVYAQEAQLAHDIVYDLLVNYSAVPAANIDKAEWDVAAAALTQLYTGYVGTPTPVMDLIGELCEQAGFTVFVDVETNRVKLVPMRAAAPSVVVDDDNALGSKTLIVDGTLAIKRDPSKRCSEVWVYYAMKNVAEDLEDKRNYRSRLVVVDGDSSYDVPQIREVFSRWIPQGGRVVAQATANRILAQFRDSPIEAEFSIHADRDGDLQLCRPFSLRTDQVQDETGDKLLHTQVVTAIERDDDLLMIKSEQATFYTQPDDGGVRTIYIESDAFNLNLREIHDQLYVAPVGGSPGEVVHFILVAGTTVGSESTGAFALDTGDWPAGVQLSMDWEGRVAGKGGNGGRGGYKGGIRNPVNGSPGQAGGPAFKVRYPISISGTGVVAGGGGGGGGGGAYMPYSVDYVATGGGGGAGAGRVSGTAGPAAAGNVSGANGQNGTLEAGGDGGEGGFIASTTHGGDGGDGGDPGQPGQAGAPAVGTGPEGAPENWIISQGGAGGAAGVAIEGMAFITFVGSPSLQILGATT